MCGVISLVSVRGNSICMNNDDEQCDVCGKWIPINSPEIWKTAEGESIGYKKTIMVTICASTSIGEIEMCAECYNQKRRFDLFTEDDLKEIHCEYGISYTMEGMYKEAVDSYKLGLNIGESDKLCFGIANAYSCIGQGDLAEKYYIRAIELNPDHHCAKSNLSLLRKNGVSGNMGSVCES